ncbi:hypothetical protein NUW58_g10235 [Xylaria curta]|uniref:Uncharacterized protein n=1 Tax=Xylaria curta TaxID=42375 RepID=A0ACC1MPW5_9PEZI|nr:hypothetical protein NUW58_g10235 [Xylaria curta]
MLFSSDEKYMKAEVNALRVHRKAEHIVQLLYADGEGVPSGNDKNLSLTAISGKSEDSAVHSDGLGEDDDEFPEPEEEPEERKEVPTANVFITEMLENGDLSCFISAVRHHGEKVPNAFLWRFLQCFTRMCIGLAWPPMSVDEFKDMPAPIRETVPARLKDTPLRICHFDLDPKTEQFCVDWDYIEPGNGIVSRHPLAGNYGPHTNIWAVGYVRVIPPSFYFYSYFYEKLDSKGTNRANGGRQLMECLITHCYPAHPPKPTISNRKPPVGKDEYWTYAAHLDQEAYNHVDRDLLDVIHRLQAHLPADRPDLQELEAYVDFNLRTKDNDGLTDEQLAQWLQKMLYEPPPESSDRWKPHPVIRSAEKPVEQPVEQPEEEPEEQPVGKPVEIIGTGPVHPVPNNRFHRMSPTFSTNPRP